MVVVIALQSEEMSGVLFTLGFAVFVLSRLANETFNQFPCCYPLF